MAVPQKAAFLQSYRHGSPVLAALARGETAAMKAVHQPLHHQKELDVLRLLGGERLMEEFAQLLDDAEALVFWRA